MSSILKINTPQQLSPLQDEFNKQVALIEKRKIELAKLHQRIEKGKQVIAEQFLPLDQEFINLKRTFVVDLDIWLDHPKITPTERDKILFLITDNIQDALSAFPDDADLNRILQKLDDEEDQDDDQLNFESLFHNLFDNDNASDEEHEPQRAKSKKQQEKQAQKEAEIKQESLHLGKMTKKLYTDLVKKLHPDREHDDAKRDHKTEIMKEVTLAYNENNIHALMHLHLRHMEGDQQLVLDELADAQLQQYLKLLKQQARDLQREIESIKYDPLLGRISRMLTGTPATQQKRINQEVDQLKSRNKAVADEFSHAKLDPKSFKKFLKSIDIEFDPFEGLIGF